MGASLTSFLIGVNGDEDDTWVVLFNCYWANTLVIWAKQME